MFDLYFWYLNERELSEQQPQVSQAYSIRQHVVKHDEIEQLFAPVVLVHSEILCKASISIEPCEGAFDMR
jgi:hypothetical protein